MHRHLGMHGEEDEKAIMCDTIFRTVSEKSRREKNKIESREVVQVHSANYNMVLNVCRVSSSHPSWTIVYTLQYMRAIQPGSRSSRANTGVFVSICLSSPPSFRGACLVFVARGVPRFSSLDDRGVKF